MVREIMVPDSWNLVCPMAEKMVNTIVLVLLRYLAWCRHRMIFFLYMIPSDSVCKSCLGQFLLHTWFITQFRLSCRTCVPDNQRQAVSCHRPFSYLEVPGISLYCPALNKIVVSGWWRANASHHWPNRKCFLGWFTLFSRLSSHRLTKSTCVTIAP